MLEITFKFLVDRSTVGGTYCLVIRQGLFSAAGVFSLLTGFLATGLYLMALQAYRISKDLENTHIVILEASLHGFLWTSPMTVLGLLWACCVASILYASPPRSPTNRMVTVAREAPATVRDESTSLGYLVSLKQLAYIA
ncbi:unnamed protein product [Brassica rapa subsp. narinosa]